MANRVYQGLDGFDEEAAGQVQFFAPRSPAHARLLEIARTVVREDPSARTLVENAWQTRAFHAHYERPLLLCAAVRFDALRDPAHPLARAIAREPPNVDAVREDAVKRALSRPLALSLMKDRFVQTNEVTRAVAWRWPVAVAAADRPIVLVDIGCSAGLNLVSDRIGVSWTDESGATLPSHSGRIVARVGIDRAPLDVGELDEADWLRACVWPGQSSRLQLLEAAMRCAREARARGELTLEAADILEVPARLDALAREHPSTLVYAYQTIVRDYLEPDVGDRYRAAMRDWLASHPGKAVWAEFERAPRGALLPAELRVSLARGGDIRALVLARADYHPQKLSIHPPALEELCAALAEG